MYYILCSNTKNTKVLRADVSAFQTDPVLVQVSREHFSFQIAKQKTSTKEMSLRGKSLLRFTEFKF